MSTATPANDTSPKAGRKGSIVDEKPAAAPAVKKPGFGCRHTKDLLTNARDKATAMYSRLIQSLRKEGNTSDRFHKGADGSVRVSNFTTYLCLQCPNVSCTRERHRKEHAFSVESRTGSVFCHECKDFVYDPTFEELRTANVRKRKSSSIADESERWLVSTHTSIASCAATGLRGLYNMGQTCFMSVILQSLVHNPLIRTFYLSEGHKSSDCDRDACTSCALDDIFNDFYGQEKHEGYGAVHMLQGCWKGGGGLAGYSQQDAHEYLGFILNSLHTAITEEGENENGSATKKKDHKRCDCIIHQSFGGTLQSTVTCSSCNNTTTALDPFMDLSLDIRNNALATKKKKLTLTNGTQTVKQIAPMHLTECLDRFTSVEHLSSDSYKCRKCNSSSGAKKKLGLARLPPVLAIHLKRFSHSKTSSASQKVETRIRFPFELDLAPFTTSSVTKPETTPQATRQQKTLASVLDDSETDAAGSEDDNDEDDDDSPIKKRMKPTSKDKTQTPAREKSTPQDQASASSSNAHAVQPVYVLSSVVVHKGKMDSGHYISYSRQEDEWFRFNDSMVVKVDEREVLTAEAYMLFYVAAELEGK